MDHHASQTFTASAGSPSYQTYRTTSATPSRIPRPSLSARQTPANATYVHTSSPSRTGSSGQLTRKRPRPTSISDSNSLLQDTATTSTLSSPYIVSPSNSYITTPTTWKHTGYSQRSISSARDSPPPMINTRYTLDGGMDTPSIAAERHYERMERMDTDNMDGRFGRAKLAERMSNEPRSGENDTLTTVLGGDRNGRGRGIAETSAIGNPTPSWSSFVLGVVGEVVGGVWTFCKTTAFRGFSAGGGQAYAIRPSEDFFSTESMWEDEGAASRSWDRLPTPVPGEYPGDTPSEDEAEEDDHYHEQGRRGSKRLHTDGGGWIVVERTRDARTRARSPRLSTPGSHGQRAIHGRPSLSSASSFRRHKAQSGGSRHAHRVSGVSFAGSPTPLAQQQQQQLYGRASLGSQRSPTNPSAPTFGSGKKMSPPSVEAKKFAARIRKEEKVADERFERLNDRLKDMIKQGKEALGSKVEIVDEDEEMW